jgi:hypothetical protein
MTEAELFTRLGKPPVCRRMGDAFARHGGAVPHNPRNSWSARSDNTVAVSLVKDNLIPGRDGFEVRWSDRVVGKRRRPGWRDLLRNLAWAEEHCDGRFRLVVRAAKNRWWPLPDVVMRLVYFDRDSSDFRAESEESPIKITWTRTTEAH